MKTLKRHLDHLFARRHMSAYVDGDLNRRKRTRLERHAADCQECGPALRQLLGITAALRALRPTSDHHGALR